MGIGPVIMLPEPKEMWRFEHKGTVCLMTDFEFMHFASLPGGMPLAAGTVITRVMHYASAEKFYQHMRDERNK